MRPKGAGPSVYARLVKEKIGQAISRRPDVTGLDVGVLTSNPDADTTEAPIAIVCEFHNPVSEDTIKEAHALAWNFSRSPLLITIEPHLLRVWTCCEPPAKSSFLNTAEIDDARINLTDASIAQQAAQSLHWAQLVTGQFFRERPDRFRRDRRADHMLLANLKYIRQRLHRLHLSYDCIHDLLARVIFIQFLFQRKDSTGQPALNESVLRRLYSDGKLSAPYTNLGQILSNYNDAYNFFRWLNERFSGDLFPGQGKTPEEREAEWRAEMAQVTPEHLELLADFVGGKIHLEGGQGFLWEMYSFDAIPLEFISSIYEVFVGKQGNGVYYTPGFLVDFILDAVLPWDSTEWDVKILDPACGSGIFLVKSFQRLVHRWRKANGGEEPPASQLKRLLQKNLFGVDIDPHAVRVASFSLYLALCDEVDPRHYWQRVEFPRLRERQVVHADFFYEEGPLFRLHQETPKYDLIIGNAPWGRNSITKPATLWAKRNGWVTPYGDIGPLFLPKAASMCKKPHGCVVMLQPAGSLIYNQVSTAREFRHKLFTEFKVDEIINLATLRFGLFRQAVSPACIITIRPVPPDGQPLLYVCPKSTHTNEDDYRVVIEPSDSHFIHQREAASDSLVWSALMWGNRRDLAFVRELARYPNINKLRARGLVKTREGVIRGDRGLKQKEILNRPILEEDNFPRLESLYLSAKKLPPNKDPYTDSAASKDFSAFDLPQLLIKQSWQTEHGRFQAAVVKSNEELGGVICSQSYISVHAEDEQLLTYLQAACLSYNSLVAVYYLLLTSGRLASYRPEPLVSELLDVPIPQPRRGLLQGLRTLSDIDARMREVFDFKDSEWALIEDLVDYTLPDFKEGGDSPARRTTRRHESPDDRSEPDLSRYCEYFLRVIKAGFGQDKNPCATIFHDLPAQGHPPTNLPVRMVAIHLDWPNRKAVTVEPIDNSLGLWGRLQQLNQNFIDQPRTDAPGFVFQRVARVYDTITLKGLSIPTVYLVKPDQRRYWTRSMALRDADEVAADILLWTNNEGTTSKPKREKKLA